MAIKICHPPNGHVCEQPAYLNQTRGNGQIDMSSLSQLQMLSDLMNNAAAQKKKKIPRILTNNSPKPDGNHKKKILEKESVFRKVLILSFAVEYLIIQITTLYYCRAGVCFIENRGVFSCSSKLSHLIIPHVALWFKCHM